MFWQALTEGEDGPGRGVVGRQEGGGQEDVWLGQGQGPVLAPGADTSGSLLTSKMDALD